jgi:two-component system, cell cycle response regulator
MSEKTKETILVVDDNPSNVKLLVRILENSGYMVQTAENGEQALAAAQSSAPNLILLDIAMPKMDGLETCTRLKSDPRTENIPIIFISAADDLENKVNAFHAGGVDFILKPFQVEEIQARIEAHLSIQRLRLQLERTNQELASRVEELTRSQDLVNERGRKLDAFIQALPTLSFVYNEEGRYLDVMANETSLLRAQAEDLKGRLIRDVMPEHVADMMMEAIQRTIKTGKTQIMEYKIQVLTGDERWFEGRTALMEKDQTGGSKVIFIATEISDRVQLYQQVQQLANMDPLINCYNRRHFMNLAETELQRSLRYKRPLSLIMLDIDHFKGFNDQYGHQLGDELLCSLVSQCQKALRNVDILGRYGGEEFVILMPETGVPGALRAAERLREKIENLKISTAQGNLSVTVSMGASSLETESQQETLDRLIKRADTALYAAKDAGRNCVKTA